MRKNSTRDFLTAWEQLNNSAAFKEPNFDLKKMSPTKWVECTGAAGIIPIRGRGAKSGIWSNADIAIEFMGDLSPQFKLFTIRELQRLKDQEASSKIAHEEWNVQRMLAKSHYQLQTDAIQSHLTQEDTIQNPHFVYASEADLINVIVYNMTAKQFRELNPGLSQSQNMRDVGTTLQASLVANLEYFNSKLISEGKSRAIREKELWLEKDRQVAVFNKKRQKEPKNKLKK